MTIIADRGLFVRPLVQSGKFEQSSADSLDSASKDPATKLDVLEVKSEISLLKVEIAAFRNETKAEFAALRGEMRAGDNLLAQKTETEINKLLVRLGGLMIALCGLLFAALRLTN